MTSSDQPMDHVPPDTGAEEPAAENQLEQHITAKSTWLRLLFMLIFVALYGLSRLVTAVVVGIQFVTVLLTGATNDQLKLWGHSLAVYSYEVVRYLTFNTEEKPFPFGRDWPGEQQPDAAYRDDESP